MKRHYHLLTFSILVCFNAVSAVLPSDDIDIKHYSFYFELSDGTDVITGKATIQIAFKKVLTAFELDLVSKNSEGKGMVVKEVTLEGKTLPFDHRRDKLNITMHASSYVGEVKTVTIFYDGIPQNGLIIGKNKYGDRTFFGDNWPDRARHWLPTNDHPIDKASVEFIVTAPSGYDVIGNGIKVEESYINTKQKLTHWKEELDIPTKVMVIGVARFAIHLEGDVSGVPVETWVFPQDRVNGFHDLATARDILEYFHKNIGPYPFRKLANVQSKTMFGGMENASNIFYSENLVNGKADKEALIAHEIAHQWFGDSASEADWRHVWLSEGFATYFSRLYSEFAHGKKVMDSLMKIDRNSVFEFYKTSPLPVVYQELPKDLFEILNTNSYQKGGWVLHMLRNEIGDDAFWKGIRQYYSTYKYSNALTSDFKKIMEDVSGQDLSSFLEQWLYRVDYPVLNGSWTYNKKTKTIDLIIMQAQQGEPFHIALELGVYSDGQLQPRIEKVKVSKSINKISIPVGSKPTRIELDPSTNLLFEGKLKN